MSNYLPETLRMMLFDETPLTLGEAARRLPTKPNRVTLWRWATKGIRGVRLETRRLGGKLVTSLEAIERFGAALAQVPRRGRRSPRGQRGRA